MYKNLPYQVLFNHAKSLIGHRVEGRCYGRLCNFIHVAGLSPEENSFICMDQNGYFEASAEYVCGLFKSFIPIATMPPPIY